MLMPRESGVREEEASGALRVPPCAVPSAWRPHAQEGRRDKGGFMLHSTTIRGNLETIGCSARDG